MFPSRHPMRYPCFRMLHWLYIIYYLQSTIYLIIILQGCVSLRPHCEISLFADDRWIIYYIFCLLFISSVYFRDVFPSSLTMRYVALTAAYSWCSSYIHLHLCCLGIIRHITTSIPLGAPSSFPFNCLSSYTLLLLSLTNSH